MPRVPRPDVATLHTLAAATHSKQRGAIKWNPLKALGGAIGGIGKITSAGVAVVDGDAQPPFSITLHDHRVTVSDSTGVIVGSGNTQKVKLNKRHIENVIEKSNSSEDEKNEAKTLLERVIGNSTLWAALSVCPETS